MNMSNEPFVRIAPSVMKTILYSEKQIEKVLNYEVKDWY